MRRTPTISFDDILAAAGLDDLPAGDKRELVLALQDTLERRVGQRLAARMSDAQLAEFDSLVAQDEQAIAAFLDEYADGWRARAGEFAPSELGDFARAHWLRIHAPDYPEVVRRAVTEVEQELRERASLITARAAGLR